MAALARFTFDLDLAERPRAAMPVGADTAPEPEALPEEDSCEPHHQKVDEQRQRDPGNIERVLGDQGLQIVSRLMGLFVCALAAQIIFTGIKGYLVS